MIFLWIACYIFILVLILDFLDAVFSISNTKVHLVAWVVYLRINFQSTVQSVQVTNYPQYIWKKFALITNYSHFFGKIILFVRLFIIFKTKCILITPPNYNAHKTYDSLFSDIIAKLQHPMALITILFEPYRILELNHFMK